jgi:hypothetical protein
MSRRSGLGRVGGPLNGEMSEWLKEHAWKANPESLTERYRDTPFTIDLRTSADDMFVGVTP